MMSCLTLQGLQSQYTANEDFFPISPIFPKTIVYAIFQLGNLFYFYIQIYKVWESRELCKLLLICLLNGIIRVYQFSLFEGYHTFLIGFYVAPTL